MTPDPVPGYVANAIADSFSELNDDPDSPYGEFVDDLGTHVDLVGGTATVRFTNALTGVRYEIAISPEEES